MHFDVRFDARYGSVGPSDVLDILSREAEPGTARFFGNLTIDPASLEVQEAVSAADRLALRANASDEGTTTALDATTTPRPPRKCSPIEFSYCGHMPYNMTSYPNLVGHRDLGEVKADIIAFRCVGLFLEGG